jgi:hypothetical protein
MDKKSGWNIWPTDRWLNFKFVSSTILLVMVTAYTFIYDSSASNDLWLCIWCLCIVRFVDVLDEMA